MRNEWIKKMGLLLGSIILTIAMIFVGQVVGILLLSTLIALFTGKADTLLSPPWETAIQYLLFIGIWIVAIIVIVVWKNNRYILNKLGRKNSGNTYKSLLIGIVLGFLMNFLCIAVALLNHDISLEYVGFYPVSFIGVFISVFIQSSAEEFICRGFLYQKTKQYFHKPAVAILVNSLLFAVLHLFNPGITVFSVLNIFFVGLMLSLLVHFTDSLWCVFAIHAAWNFTQNIIFGLPNSGITTPYSVFKLNADSARNSFAYNVGFGIEGTILANVVLVMGCICTYIWGKNKRKKEISE